MGLGGIIMNILFTICGRAGSKGFKNKNLKTFCGVPLVFYSLAAVKLYIEKYGCTDYFDITLNTDSNDLMDIVTKQQKSLQVDCIQREESLGGDRVPKVAVIYDCLIKMEKTKGITYDVIVDLDITSPLRTVNDIKAAIDRKKERPDVDVVYSVTDSRRNPYFNMVKQEGDYFAKAIASVFTTRQEAPSFFDMNASIYAYEPSALKCKDQSTFFNDKCYAIVMKDTGVLDIDSEEDFELMQVIADYLYHKQSEFGEIFEMAKKIKEA